MKADRSRDTFDPAKHYRRVLHQQGRVVLDADDNEQVSIDLATSERTMSDVIGPSGVPETSLTAGYSGGFALGISNASSSSSSGSSSSSSSSGQGASSSSSSSSSSGIAGNQLTIAHGRIYVDGILVINDQDTTLYGQPYLPLNFGDSSPTGLAGAGVYAAFLDVWERVVTPIDDPNIQEVALGGPDTCLRTQIVWQVRLSKVDTSEFGQNPVCAQILPPWPQNFNPGQLTASPAAPAADPQPCTLPPQTGYLSLENQLYRVEVHTPGPYGTASFKWSRENGSVVFGIVAGPNQSSTGTVSGTQFYVTSTGRDATLSVAQDDWVELIDDRTEFLQGHGELFQVQTVDPDQVTITLKTAPATPVDLTLHPKLRRWDQTNGVGGDGTVLIANGTPIALESGVQVQFSNGQYSVGDYWLIPARTATTQQQVGTIEWPQDANGNYQPQGPKGIKHHYCKLGIVAFDGMNFQPPQGSSAVTDCRAFFPPLTQVQLQQCPCTITLQPNTNWTAQLANLFPGNVAVDAEICFAVGEFDTTQPVVINTTGNVKVSGAGWGTKLVGQGLETVLRFENCASVSVRDLSAVANRVDGPVDAVTKHIGGALEFDDCAEVKVDNVSLTCGTTTSTSSGAACLTVRNTITTANASTGVGTVYVRDSRFLVGQLQYGMLLVHVQHAFLEGNDLRTMTRTVVPLPRLLADKTYQKLAVRALIGGANVAAAATQSSSSSSSSSSSAAIAGVRLLKELPVKSLAATVALRPPNSGVKVGATTLTFSSPPQVKGVWQTYLDANAPKEFASNADLLTYLKGAATTLLTNTAVQKQYSGVVDILRLFERTQVLSGRAGIVIGGRGITDLRVADNSIDGFMQGVVVGMSHKEATPVLPADSATVVSIRDNRINVLIDAVLGRAAGRYAIYVGNVTSLQVDNNRATANVPAGTAFDTDGIRVFGYLGNKMVVRHNHVTGFTTGIRVTQVAGVGGRERNTTKPPGSEAYLVPQRVGPLWLVADNMLEKATTPINAPTCLQIDNCT